MTTDHTRLFDFDRFAAAIDQNRELVRQFAAHDAFRSAMVEELELDEDFYRRPLRPEDLSFIKFTERVSADTVARLPFLATQRMLLCINELQITRLPRDNSAKSFDEFARFYGDDSQVLGARIRPFLENFAFDFLCRDGDSLGDTGSLVARLDELLQAETTFGVEAFDRLARAGYLDDGLRFSLVQKWSLFPSKRVAIAKAAALGYFDAVAPSDWPRLSGDDPTARVAAQIAARCDITKREHSYWQFYLSTSLAECNLLHALASRPDRALALCGAAFAAEAQWMAFGAALAHTQVPGSAMSAESAAVKAGLLARFERALAAIAERFGARGVQEVGKGLAAVSALAASARDNLGDQLRWLASVDKYRDIAQTISARIAVECPDIDRETFVEPREMCSTTHVHDDHRLVVIESGNMVFWGNLGMTLRLAPGEMVLVPEGRLHGSTIESDECTYHQPIIPDAWVRPLIDGLEPTIGA
jgi:hypothetical protein